MREPRQAEDPGSEELWIQEHKDLLSNPVFHACLLKFDCDIAAIVQGRGCQVCKGKKKGALHRADYMRKPRGRPFDLELDLAEHNKRFSFCCAKEGCRARETPPSLRFFGSRRYLGAVIVLVPMLQNKVSATLLKQLREFIGVDRKTVMGWRRWWQNAFNKSDFWRNARAGFVPPVEEARLPTSLFERFFGAASKRAGETHGAAGSYASYASRTTSGTLNSSAIYGSVRPAFIEQMFLLLQHILPLTGGQPRTDLDGVLSAMWVRISKP